jgi:hypothetical protein
MRMLYEARLQDLGPDDPDQGGVRNLFPDESDRRNGTLGCGLKRMCSTSSTSRAAKDAAFVAVPWSRSYGVMLGQGP